MPQLRARGVDCIAVAEDIVLASQEGPVVLEAALAASRVLVTNNVVDFERLRTQRSASDQPVPQLIYTSEAAFPRNRQFIGRLIDALDYAAKTSTRLRHRRRPLAGTSATFNRAT